MTTRGFHNAHAWVNIGKFGEYDYPCISNLVVWQHHLLLAYLIQTTLSVFFVSALGSWLSVSMQVSGSPELSLPRYAWVHIFPWLSENLSMGCISFTVTEPDDVAPKVRSLYIRSIIFSMGVLLSRTSQTTLSKQELIIWFWFWEYEQNHRNVNNAWWCTDSTIGFTYPYIQQYYVYITKHIIISLSKALKFRLLIVFIILL